VLTLQQLQFNVLSISCLPFPAKHSISSSRTAFSSFLLIKWITGQWLLESRISVPNSLGLCKGREVHVTCSCRSCPSTELSAPGQQWSDGAVHSDLKGER